MEQVLALARTPGRSVKTALFCLAYAAAAALLFPSTFAAVFNNYPLQRFYVVLPPLLFAGLLGAAIWHRPRSPLTFLRDKLIDRGTGFLLILAVVLVSVTAFTTLKHEFSFLVPFHADPFLARLDSAIHLGDPWRWARAIVPSALDIVLFTLYSQFWFVQIVGVIIYAAFLQDRHDRERYFLVFATSAILLSSAVRLIGSSAGPIFYDRMFGGSRFADLIAALQNSEAGPQTLTLSNYLYESFAANTSVLGTGISAMPSLHVALAFLNALFISSRHRIAGRFAWTYAGIIMFGSVYFGWHYAVDGYVSMLAVWGIWRWASKTA